MLGKNYKVSHNTCHNEQRNASNFHSIIMTSCKNYPQRLFNKDKLFKPQISLADVNFYAMQLFMKANLEDYPEINGLCERIENVEGIKQYLDSQKK